MAKMIVDKQGQPCSKDFINIVSGQKSKYIQIATRNSSQMEAYKQLFIKQYGAEQGLLEFELAVNLANAGNAGDVIEDKRKFLGLF